MGYFTKRSFLRKLSVPAVAAVVLLAVFSSKSGFLAGERSTLPEKLTVTWVIDGDTIEVAAVDGRSGKRIRYAGIDTPERDEPFYDEARLRNKALLDGALAVTFEPCTDDPFDKYGRRLGWVYADGVDVSEVLLAEGLAKVFAKPPCGTKRYQAYKAVEKSAHEKGLGVWGKAR